MMYLLLFALSLITTSVSQWHLDKDTTSQYAKCLQFSSYDNYLILGGKDLDVVKT